LALPRDGQLQFKTGKTQLNVTNNLRIVPDVPPNCPSADDVMIGVSQFFDTPLYWQLPDSVFGDRTISYNGLLLFTATNPGGSTLFPDNILATYPLVQIQGNRKIILEYYPHAPHPNGRFQVRSKHLTPFLVQHPHFSLIF
jgi:laminin alpha 1/2